MHEQLNRLAIVGGGAAGLACAIAAGRSARQFGNALSVTVYEADDRVGRSILATGNGRCNFSNAHIDARAYYNDDFAKAVLSSPEMREEFSGQPDAVHAFFESLGLVWREEGDGRQYPLANKASSVVDVLRAECSRLGVHEACENKLASIEAPGERTDCFTLRMTDGRFERADAVVIACGGSAMETIEVDGVHVLRMRPVLGPLKCAETDVTRELDNIRAKCAVTLKRPNGSDGFDIIASEKGEVMFRKYGVSGICVFNLSRFAWPGDVLAIDFLGGASALEFMKQRSTRFEHTQGEKPSCDDMMRGVVLPRVAGVMFKRAGLQGAEPCDRSRQELLAHQLGEFELTVAGIADPGMCQVHRGGIDVHQVDASTMAVSGVAGLFAAGEALDVDGPCGGYNLHWAWASGLLAGISAAAYVAGGAE